MEEITDLILRVIIDTVKNYHNNLFKDFGNASPIDYSINIHMALTLLLIENLAVHFKYAKYDLGRDVRITLVEGKIVEHGEIFDGQHWVEVNGFVVDLLESKTLARLEFDKGIAEKLKEDAKTHYAVRVLHRDDFYFGVNSPVVLNRNPSPTTIMKYVKSILR